MSWSVIKSRLIVLFDLTTKVRECLKCPWRFLGEVPRFGWVGICSTTSAVTNWHDFYIFLSNIIIQVIDRNVFLTPCCQLWTFANTFVVVCILCTEITSWLPNAAYFACCSTVAFKVYPVEWKRKNEGRGSLWLLFLKGNVRLTSIVLWPYLYHYWIWNGVWHNDSLYIKYDTYIQYISISCLFHILSHYFYFLQCIMCNSICAVSR